MFGSDGHDPPAGHTAPCPVCPPVSPYLLDAGGQERKLSHFLAFYSDIMDSIGPRTPERYYLLEVVTVGLDTKPQYRISVYNGGTLLLSSFKGDEPSRDQECKWWEEFGYVRLFRAPSQVD